VFWEMGGGDFVTNHNLPGVATTWQIRGTEDFDSDGDGPTSCGAMTRARW
jgi:hypothetical protein